MATIPLDKDSFRARFTAFSATTDEDLDLWYLVACQYISDEDWGLMQGAVRELALQQMLAHLLALNAAISAGTPLQGITDSATIDKISVSLTVAPVKTQWDWWLSLTPYGAMLYALLQTWASAGFFVGGAPERAAFRGIGRGYVC
jgi:hypothetical protein